MGISHSAGGNKYLRLPFPDPSRWRVELYLRRLFFPEPAEYFPPETEDPAATVTGAAAPEPEPEPTSRRCPEAPCHHHAQGVSVNPFGYPPLSDQ